MKSKEVKRREAESRQAAHDAHSREEKLAMLAQRPGEARRERGRLLYSAKG